MSDFLKPVADDPEFAHLCEVVRGKHFPHAMKPPIVDGKGVDLPPGRGDDPPEQNGSKGGGPGRSRIPGYELLQEIGRGGMGVVYEARQLGMADQHDQAVQKVAVKTILDGDWAGKETQDRFVQEGQILGQLNDHPHIVKVLDVGICSSGHPYIAMEFMAGGSLEKKPLAPIEERRGQEWAARCVALVARGVHAAHQRGIIHRDLKPANCLLTQDGVPKVTDFGLAICMKSGRMLTKTLRRIGTPEYMAPEQASGRQHDTLYADVRMDVYSLGAVLYKLLTGRPPRQGENPLQILWKAKHEDLEATPRQLNQQLDRDLETICMKCLAWEPDRRYSSAEALALDLERWIEHRPIKARPFAWWERWRLWCKREPVVATLCTILAVVVPLGIGGIVWQWQTAVEEREQKSLALKQVLEEKQQKERALKGEEAINDFFSLRVIAATRPPGLGGIKRNVTLLTALQAAEPHLVTDFAGHPHLAARLHTVFGDTYVALGNRLAAHGHFEKAWKLSQQAYGPGHEQTLLRQAALGSSYLLQNKLSEAAPLLLGAHEGMKHLPVSAISIRLSLSVGDLYRRRGDLVQAEKLLRDALAQSRELLGDTDENTLSTQVALGDVLGGLNKWKEAEALLRDAVSKSQDGWGDDNPFTTYAQVALGAVLAGSGQKTAAKEILGKALQKNERLLGLDHPNTLNSQFHLALALESHGELQVSEQRLASIVAHTSRILGTEDPETLKQKNFLGLAIYSQARYAEAARLFQEVYTACERVLPSGHSLTLTTMTNLASALLATGRPNDRAEGIKLLPKALEQQRRTLGRENPVTLATLNTLGDAWFKHGEIEKALDAFEEATLACRRVLPPDHPQTLLAEGNWGGVLMVRGRRADWEKAFPMLERVLDAKRRTLGYDHPSTLFTQNSLALAFVRRKEPGDLTKAIDLIADALKTLRRQSGARHPDTLLLGQNLALLRFRRDRGKDREEAIALMRQILASSIASRGPEHPLTLTMQCYYYHMTSVCDPSENWTKTIRIWEEMVRKLQGMRSQDYPELHTLQVDLAGALLRTRDVDYVEKAVAMLGRTLTAQRRVYGPHHPTAVRTQVHWGEALLQQGKKAEAEEAARAAWQICESDLRSNHDVMGRARSLLGSCLAQAGRYAEAEPHLVASHDALSRLPHPDAENMARVTNRIIDLYDAWGRKDQAKTWRDKRAQLKQP